MKKSDLNQIKSRQELERIVLEAAPAIDAHRDDVAYHNAAAGTEILRDDATWQIAIIDNKGAACKLGSDTDWCTASRDLNYFEQYYKKEDPLFFLLKKNIIKMTVEKLLKAPYSVAHLDKIKKIDANPEGEDRDWSKYKEVKEFQKTFETKSGLDLSGLGPFRVRGDHISARKTHGATKYIALLLASKNNPKILKQVIKVDLSKRFQFHYGSKQFMDENDWGLEDEKKFKLHSMLVAALGEKIERYPIVLETHKEWKTDMLLSDPKTLPEELKKLADEIISSTKPGQLGTDYWIFTRLIGHLNTPPETLTQIAEFDLETPHGGSGIRHQDRGDRKFELAVRVAGNSRTPKDTLDYLGDLEDIHIRDAVAANPLTSRETLQQLSRGTDRSAVTARRALGVRDDPQAAQARQRPPRGRIQSRYYDTPEQTTLQEKQVFKLKILRNKK